VNFSARSRTRNRKVVARSPRSTTRLQAGWVVHDPWLAGHPKDVQTTVADLEREQEVDPPRHAPIIRRRISTTGGSDANRSGLINEYERAA
jgi:hypothetical protein